MPSTRDPGGFGMHDRCLRPAVTTRTICFKRAMATPREPPRATIDDLLEEARARLSRLTPSEALAAQAAGAILVDVRGDDQCREGGCIPGAIRIPRNVLEWRVDPACPACDPRIAHLDAVIIVICQQGYQSSLAARTLQKLGVTRATDLDGGFEAWRAAGLPIEAAAHCRS
jgi:rhodanese-related sulfurtransferase